MARAKCHRDDHLSILQGTGDCKGINGGSTRPQGRTYVSCWIVGRVVGVPLVVKSTSMTDALVTETTGKNAESLNESDE